MALATVGTALSIANQLGVTDWLGELLFGDKGEQVADRVVDLALEITGTQSPSDASELIQQLPQVADELKKLLIANQQELVRLSFADKAQARQLYQSKNHMADLIAQRVMTWNLPMIVVMIIANVLVAMFVKESGVAQLLGNLIGMVTTQLYKERQTIVEFFFGAGLGGQQTTPEKKLGPS